MKKIKRWLKDIFDPENDLDMDAVRSALNDASIRTIWLSGCLEEVRQLSREIDRRILTGHEFSLTDLCVRRKAYQDMLEAVLSARRQVTKEPQDKRPNPRIQDVNLDRVTA